MFLMFILRDLITFRGSVALFFPPSTLNHIFIKGFNKKTHLTTIHYLVPSMHTSSLTHSFIHLLIPADPLQLLLAGM